jgi:hypothetical protein
MEDLKQIQEFFSKPLKEGTLDQGEIAIYIGNDDAGTTHIFKRGKGYYGYNDEFDFEAKDRADLEQKLKSFGYELLAGSLDEATKEEETEFHTKLDKLVHDTFGKRKGEMEEEISDYEEKEADYDKLYSDYLYKMVREVAAEKGYSKYLVSKDNPKGETDGLTPATLNKILMNVIKDIKETIELGKNLNEELCPKGKAYIKKRQAAGENSSAYLSGRAVKVCKGQMKG